MGWIFADDWRLADLLPAIYVAGLIGALAWILARFFDSAPRRVWGILAVFLLVLFGPVLLGGRVLLPLDNLRRSPPWTHLPPSSPGGHPLQSDLVREIAPHLIQVRRAYAAGEWPLWNDLVGAGMPVLADPQTQAFQPLVWLAAPFPVHQAVGITAALRVAVAFVFLFILLRRAGLEESAAVLGAAAYALSGATLRWLGWPLVNAVALLPPWLYAIARTVEVRGRRDTALLTLATFALLAGGQPEAILYALAFGTVFAATALAGSLPHRPGRQAMLHLVAAIAIGAALTTPGLLVAHQYLPQSERAVALETAFGGRDLATALAESARPEVLGEWRQRIGQRMVSLVAPRAWGDYDAYRGETNLIDDGAGFVGTGTLLLALVALLGPATGRWHPAFRWSLGAALVLLFQPPGFEILTYRLPLVGFTAAHKHRRLLFVVALCLAYLAAAGLQSWRASRRQRIAVWTTTIALGSLVLWSYLFHQGFLGPADSQRFTALSLGSQMVALGATAILLMYCSPGRRRDAMLIAVTCGELLFAHLPANVPNSRHLAYPETPGVTFLRERLGTGRMVGLGRVFPANTPSALGLADARIANASEPAAFARLTEPLRVPGGWGVYRAGDHPLYDLMGVRFVAVWPRIRLELPLVYRGPDLWVYERTTALPLFLVRKGETEGSRPSGLAILRMKPTRVSAHIEIDREEIVTASVYQDGNWRLFVDGKAAILERAAEDVFITGRLPAGRHQIDLVYRPRRFAAGMMMAAAAILAGIAWWIPAPETGAGWLSATPGACDSRGVVAEERADSTTS